MLKEAVGATVVSVAIAWGAYTDHTANVAPVLAKAEDEAGRIVPPVSVVELKKAQQIRIKYSSDLSKVYPANSNTGPGAYDSFDPLEIARLSTQPEVLEASSVLNQNQQHQDEVHRILRPNGAQSSWTETRDTLDKIAGAIGGLGGLVAGAFTLAGSYTKLASAVRTFRAVSSYC